MSGSNSYHFPLDNVETIIATRRKSLERFENGIRWHVDCGITEIRVDKVEILSLYGLKVHEAVTVKTSLDDSARDLSDEFIAVMNRMSALSGLMRDPKTGEVFIVNRLSILEGDEGTIKLHAHLIASSALLQESTYVGMIAMVVDNQSLLNSLDKLPDSDDNTRWSGQDFAQVKHYLDNAGCLTFSHEDRLSSEFPWDPESVSAFSGDRTSLFLLSTQEPHPFFGNGLSYKLELPITYPVEIIAQKIVDLNAKEFSATVSVPLYGSWCSRINDGSVIFIGFLPNFVYWPGIATNIAFWLLHRSKIVKTWL